MVHRCIVILYQSLSGYGTNSIMIWYKAYGYGTRVYRDMAQGIGYKGYNSSLACKT